MDKIADDLEKWVKDDLPDSYSSFIQQDRKLGSIIRGESFNRVLDYLQEHDSEKSEKLHNLQMKLGYQMSSIASGYKNRVKLFEFLGSIGYLEKVLHRLNLQDEIDALFAEIRTAKKYALRIIDLLRSTTALAREALTPEKSADTEQKEIVEVKPGAFGITINIKEIAKRIWKRVCSRSKD